MVGCTDLRVVLVAGVDRAVLSLVHPHRIWGGDEAGKGRDGSLSSDREMSPCDGRELSLRARRKLSPFIHPAQDTIQPSAVQSE